ncbi:hypothetical protein ACFSL6_25950 [Paenibacillus thailandensis]|uniref:hypothetical protein n=1 Tax=Paenibacillus thailandensis TaxID=393250 RepID=UPI00362E28DC
MRLRARHYSSPIEVLEETAIKYDGRQSLGFRKVGGAHGRVSAYHYVPNGALDPGGGFEDPLDTFDLTREPAQAYTCLAITRRITRDTGRAVRTSTNPGYLIYKTDYDMSSFLGSRLSFYRLRRSRSGEIFRLADGQTYEEIAAERLHL